MLINEMFSSLREDADTDLASYRAAGELMGRLIRTLMSGTPDNDFGFTLARFPNEAPLLVLRGHDIGLTGEEARLWFRFGSTRAERGGHFARFKKSGDPAITIYCLDDVEDTERAAKTIIYTSRVHAALMHELTHYLDDINDPLPEKPLTPSDGAPYYNTAHEFKAYYLNIAQPLLQFLRITRDDPALPVARMADRMGIAREFKANLTMMLKRGKDFGNFVTHLDRDRREQFMERLYALHKAVVQRLDADTTAQATASPADAQTPR